MGLQAASLRQAAGHTDLAISIMGETALHMIGTGHLHQTQQLTQQAILLGRKPEAFVLPVIGWPMAWQAEVLREWNQLDANTIQIRRMTLWMGLRGRGER